MAKVTLAIVLTVVVCIYLQVQSPIPGTQGQSTGDLSSRTVQLLVILAPDENLRPGAVADLLAVRYGLEIHNNWYIESLQRNCYVLRVHILTATRFRTLLYSEVIWDTRKNAFPTRRGYLQ